MKYKIIFAPTLALLVLRVNEFLATGATIESKKLRTDGINVAGDKYYQMHIFYTEPRK